MLARAAAGQFWYVSAKHLTEAGLSAGEKGDSVGWVQSVIGPASSTDIKAWLG